MKTKIFLVILLINLHLVSFSQISQKGQPLTYNKTYSELLKSQIREDESSNKGVIIVDDIDINKVKKRIKEIKGDCTDCRSKIYGKSIGVYSDFFKHVN